VTTVSLLRDRDLDVRNNYAERQYLAFHAAPLAPTGDLEQMLTPGHWDRTVAVAAVMFSAPVILFAHQIYPEVPGALLLVVAFRALVPLTGGRRSVRLAFVLSFRSRAWFC
jgi:hypothetical protein